MTDDLVKRLRLWGEHGLTNTLSDLAEAADRIEALTAENERLRKAGTKLAGFAAHDSECEDITGAYPGSCSCGYSSAWKAWSAALGDTQ